MFLLLDLSTEFKNNYWVVSIETGPIRNVIAL